MNVELAQKKSAPGGWPSKVSDLSELNHRSTIQTTIDWSDQPKPKPLQVAYNHYKAHYHSGMDCRSQTSDDCPTGSGSQFTRAWTCLWVADAKGSDWGRVCGWGCGKYPSSWLLTLTSNAEWIIYDGMDKMPRRARTWRVKRVQHLLKITGVNCYSATSRWTNIRNKRWFRWILKISSYRGGTVKQRLGEKLMVLTNNIWLVCYVKSSQKTFKNSVLSPATPFCSLGNSTVDEIWSCILKEQKCLRNNTKPAFLMMMLSWIWRWSPFKLNRQWCRHRSSKDSKRVVSPIIERNHLGISVMSKCQVKKMWKFGLHHVKEVLLMERKPTQHPEELWNNAESCSVRPTIRGGWPLHCLLQGKQIVAV